MAIVPRMLAGVTAVVVLSAATPALAAPPDRGLRNVIHLVGDGMGFNQVDLGSLYEHGVSQHQVEVDASSGRVRRVPGRPTQVYQHFPVRGAVATFQDGAGYDPRKAWSDFEHVLADPPDSAATATALATGVRSYNAAIGVDRDGKPVENLAERAHKLGKTTGVVSSVPYSHATPAAYTVHNEHRDNYHEISKAMLTSSDVNVVMAPGHPWFDADGKRRAQPVYEHIDEPTWTAATTGGTKHTFVSAKDDIVGLAHARKVPKHVFAVPEVAQTLQYQRGGTDKDAQGDPVPGARPYQAPPVRSVPSLSQLTASALNVLHRGSDRGFFLMVEGGAIDWASHENRPNRLVEEQLAFNRAVETVVDWVERHSSWRETLVVVTADHETGYLTGPGANPDWTALTGTRGKLADTAWHTYGHTGSLVPLYAKGRGAEAIRRAATGVDPVRGRYLENIAVPKVVFEQWTGRTLLPEGAESWQQADRRNVLR
ncbi:alkaline phosphatase [Crossiella equi]|uniref:Alkaline phosphatase n=1 Tax=Crossiella equi TaxID=130796 RepID=A0ABS5A5T2_9PSEU|nr:alkaline phosphatase [Crossiella equi]MBP2471911.1 alkaline phosphatase [Crossiella equi]